MKKFSKLIMESVDYDHLLTDMKDHAFEITVDSARNIIKGTRNGGNYDIKEITRDFEELIGRLQDEYGLVKGDFSFNTKGVSFTIHPILSPDDNWVDVIVGGKKRHLKPIFWQISQVWKKGIDINNVGRDAKSRVDSSSVFEFSVYLANDKGTEYYLTWNSRKTENSKDAISNSKYLPFEKDNIELKFGTYQNNDVRSSDVKIDIINCSKICYQVRSGSLKCRYGDEEGDLHFKNEITPEKLVK